MKNVDVRMRGASTRALLLIVRSTGREGEGQWLLTVEGAGATTALGRGGPTRSPHWPVASNDSLGEVAIGASLGFQIFLPNLIFHKIFIIF